MIQKDKGVVNMSAFGLVYVQAELQTAFQHAWEFILDDFRLCFDTIDYNGAAGSQCQYTLTAVFRSR